MASTSSACKDVCLVTFSGFFRKGHQLRAFDFISLHGMPSLKKVVTFNLFISSFTNSLTVLLGPCTLSDALRAAIYTLALFGICSHLAPKESPAPHAST